MEKTTLLYPSCLREAQQLGYEVEGGDVLIEQGEFVSENQMEWEGELELSLCRANNESNGTLGAVRVRAKAHYTSEIIGPFFRKAS